MSTISAVSAASVYANNAPTNSAVSAALAQVAATQLSVMNTLVSLGSNDSSSPLTYTAAGLPGSLQQTTSGTTGSATTNAQAAQNAYLEVQYAISQTLSSLVSGTSPLRPSLGKLASSATRRISSRRRPTRSRRPSRRRAVSSTRADRISGVSGVPRPTRWRDLQQRQACWAL